MKIKQRIYKEVDEADDGFVMPDPSSDWDM
jgi:hypothetical protein